MRIPSVITFLDLIVCVNLAAADATNAPASQQAMQQLRSVKRFALGGVGYGLTISEGEVAYRTIVTNTNAVQLFKTVLTNGTTEAKLYALCGIRQLAPKEFDACAKPIVAANQKVGMQSGCFGGESLAYIVASRIKDGSYDPYLTSEPRSQPWILSPVVASRGPGK